MASGATTRPEVDKTYYVGNELRYISFTYMMLRDGRVVVHSGLTDTDDHTYEDFLYEVSDRRDAYEIAYTMVEDAAEYLEAEGVVLDNNLTVRDFLARLRQELGVGLH